MKRKADEPAAERPAPGEPLSGRADSGIDGLDEILGGGFIRGNMCLIEGDPGSGKTTLALQFLRAGRKRGERGVYITLSETPAELKTSALSHGWDLEGIEIIEMIAPEDALRPEAQYTLFHPAEIELAEISRAVLDRVDAICPSRVVLDSLSEMRLLAQNPLRYRRQLLALKQFFQGRGCTVLVLDDRTSDIPQLQLHSFAHGVVSLEHSANEFGPERRRLRVIKMRGLKFHGGYHDLKIATGGIFVYPQLVAAEHHETFQASLVASGLAELDALLGGGLSRGTSTLFMGPAGAGKSTLTMQYAMTAAARGERVAIFVFDETIETLCARARGIGMAIDGFIRDGTIRVYQVDPGEMPPGEFISLVRTAVDVHGCRLAVIDSLNGYLNAMPGERHLSIQLHELLTFLARKGVTTLLVMAQSGLIGSQMQAPIDISYLSDTVLLLRYYESRGEVRLALSALKKRTGRHERTIRQMTISPTGIAVGPPLTQLQGVLTGTPTGWQDGKVADHASASEPAPLDMRNSPG